MAIQIELYNPNWSEEFEVEALRIKRELSNNCIEIHHIGSTSVKGLTAKPIIDIFAVVNDISAVDYYNNAMKSIGFDARGEYGIPFRRYFTKDNPIRTYQLHVFQQGNSEIELNLLFRNYLRSNPKAMQEYANLKISLASNEENSKKPPGSLLSYYTLSKDEFIRNILSKAGFKSPRLVFVSHFKEWEAYHRIVKKQLYDLTRRKYNPKHLIVSPHHLYFALLQGLEVVSISCIEILNIGEAIIKFIVIDEPYKNSDFEKIMIQMLKEWLWQRGIKVVKYL